jgi:G:T-mismatch repair DNA endonuclease (very short patch repair protein)
MFGTYWHRGENPQKRINSFMHFGFATVVIWEYELKNESSVVDKIKNFPSMNDLYYKYNNENDTLLLK